MKVVRGFFSILAKLCGSLSALLLLVCVPILVIAVSTLIFDGVDAFTHYLKYESFFFMFFGVTFVCALLFGALGGTSDKDETEQPRKRPVPADLLGSNAFSGSASGCEPSLFDAGGYVESHCTGYIYGLVTESDLNAIRYDSSLSEHEKEVAEAELEHKAIMYY